MSKGSQPDGEMLKGTLDMMILRTPLGGTAHGHTIAKIIERTSEDVLEVEQGSLYPALHRLENPGWEPSHWVTSENETSRWRQMTRAIGLVMGDQIVANGGGE
jgi:PadR family transcriptional regulator PadR